MSEPVKKNSVQPKGTRTYKGNRVTGPGVESFEKDDKILETSGKLHSTGKEAEAKDKEKSKPEVKAAIPAKPEMNQKGEK